MRIQKIFCLVFFLTVFCFSIVSAQSFSASINRINADAFPSIKAVVKIWNKTPEVFLPKNFELLEDATQISTFSINIMKPKQFVILLLDRSSSIKPALKTIKLAASSFAIKMMKSVSLGLISFASDIEHEQSFTSDTGKIIKAIQRIRSWGGTSLYDALYEGCVEINLKAGRNDLKTIVCLTDGRDSTPAGHKPISIKKPKDVIAQATKNNIRLVMIGLGNDVDAKILKNFAQTTQGWFLQPKQASDLEELYTSISERILHENYYQIRYTTPKHVYDGKKRFLEIISRFKGKKDQDKSSYSAPVLADIKNKQKNFTTLKINISTLILPDSPYLTKPIIVPSPSPVFIPNKASFSNQSSDECEAIIRQAKAKITNDCNADLDKQYIYVDNFKQHLDLIKKKIDIVYSKKQYQPHEVARVNYRYETLDNIMTELGAKREKCYEQYNLRLQFYIDQLGLLKREYVLGEKIPSSMYAALRTTMEDAENIVIKHYQKKKEKSQSSLAAIKKKYSRILGQKFVEKKHSFRSKEIKGNTPTFSGKFKVYTPETLDDKRKTDTNSSRGVGRNKKKNGGIDLSIPVLKTLD